MKYARQIGFHFPTNRGETLKKMSKTRHLVFYFFIVRISIFSANCQGKNKTTTKSFKQKHHCQRDGSIMFQKTSTRQYHTFSRKGAFFGIRI